mmetsp:Transcript_64962/g.115142  ORF Transcript_64962/g.115142 Transcript_64962/m.115142 type:complete len:82 (+) Transcript_64962:333-578(+)
MAWQTVKAVVATSRTHSCMHERSPLDGHSAQRPCVHTCIATHRYQRGENLRYTNLQFNLKVRAATVIDHASADVLIRRPGI